LRKGGELSALEKAAVAEAEERVRGLGVRGVADRAVRWRGAGVVVMLIMCMVIVEKMFPGFVVKSWTRFTEPLTRIEPYTRAEFDVKIEDSKVRVKVSGAEVSRADLVWVGKDGAEIRVPMLKQGTDEFTLELMGEPLSDAFYIDTPVGRSARLSSGQLANRSKSDGRGSAGLRSGSGSESHGNPGGEGKGAGEGTGKTFATPGGEEARGRDVDEGGKLVGGVQLIDEKREATTRPMTELDRAQLKDIPVRYRWVVERYLENK
jgi:hypothetical protein